MTINLTIYENKDKTTEYINQHILSLFEIQNIHHNKSDYNK